MKIADKIFPVNIIQGPLAGVSCAPFRMLAWRYSKPAFSYTEMISCQALIRNSLDQQRRFLAKDPAEGPVCYQLLGNKPEDLAIATKIVTDVGADLIDLNCGCSVAKVRRQGQGSRLLTNPVLLYKLICAMKQNTHLPISIKIRVEGASGEKFHDDIVKVVKEAGVDCLVVHGRHSSEHYDTPCRYDDIRFFVEQLKIPVIGNGDVADIASLKKMLATGCAGVMVGRAGVGQPWLIGKLCAALQNSDFILPSFVEIGEIFVEQVARLIELLGCEKIAVLQARKLASHYARYLPTRREFCVTINSCENFTDFKKICTQYFL